MFLEYTAPTISELYGLLALDLSALDDDPRTKGGYSVGSLSVHYDAVKDKYVLDVVVSDSPPPMVTE